MKEYGAKGNGVNDDWFSIQSALAAAAANNGGVVYFPSGDYILREGITVPSGIIVRGNGGLVSDGLTNFTLVNRGPTRIRLTGNELMKSDAIFLIGECSQQIRFENLELKGTVPGEEFGVELLGKATSSQDIQFSNVGFTDLNIGIYAHALPSSNGLSWQVDYLKVDNCFFNRNTNAGIYVNAFNSNWSITNSIFPLLPKIAATRPSNAIYALRSGAINVEKSYAVGQSESSGGRGGDFVHAEFTGPITVSDSSVEGMSNGLAVGNEPVSVGGATYYASDYSYPITLKGNILGRSVEIRGRRNIVSIGNLYYPTAFINSVDHEVRIYSLGDRFCYDQIPEQPDPENSAQTCLEPRSTDFGEATIVFRTGQLGNGTGERAAGGPTKFGFDVEIQADNATALETVGTPLLSVPSPPTFYDGKPLLRLGDRNSYYDLGRNGSGTLVFDAGPVEPQLPINPYRGFAFERPVRLPSFRYEDLQTGAGYFSTMGIGTTVFCTDCQRQSSPCSLASSGGGAIAIVNLISGYFGWQCQ